MDDTRAIIEALINEPINPKAQYFGTHAKAKERIIEEIKIPQILKRGRKKIEKFEKKFSKSTDSTLLITKGKGDDVMDVEEKAEEIESEKEETPKKKKGYNTENSQGNHPCIQSHQGKEKQEESCFAR